MTFFTFRQDVNKCNFRVVIKLICKLGFYLRNLDNSPLTQLIIS